MTLIHGRTPGRSPHSWFGPALGADRGFDIQVLFHPDMGAGGVLCRMGGDSRWSSFDAASSTGLENLVWPPLWSVGHGQNGPDDRPFAGTGLQVSFR